MSTAAIAAETLDTCLREQQRQRPDNLDGLARGFQRRLARRNADPWMLSTGEDLRYPTTTGARATALTRLQHRYLDRVVVAATQDPAIAKTYHRSLDCLTVQRHCSPPECWPPPPGPDPIAQVRQRTARSPHARPWRQPADNEAGNQLATASGAIMRELLHQDGGGINASCIDLPARE